MRPATLLLSALLFATTAVPVEAQLLQGEWFKLTVSLAGTGFNDADNESEAFQIKKVVRYAQLGIEAVEGTVGPTYAVSVYSPTTEGGWTDGFVGTISMLDTAETWVQTAQINLPTKPVTVMEGSAHIASVTFNGSCKIKIKNDELKSAKITSLGTISYFTNESDAFYGKAKLTLTRVDIEDLPFEVAILEATKPQPEPTKVEPKTEAKVEAKREEKLEAKPEQP